MKDKFMALGCDSPIFKKGKDISEIMDMCRYLGIAYFDTARGYGRSEQVLGEYIRSHGKREEYYVISKGCLPTFHSRLNPKCLRKDLEASIRTLDIGYIDLYLLHRDDRRADLYAILKILNEYREAGIIKAYGLSNWKIERIREFNRIAREHGFPEASGISNNFTPLRWKRDPWGGGDGCVSWANDKEAIDYMKETGLPLFDYSPLARGFLTGRIKSNDPHTFENVDRASKRAYLSEDNLKRLSVLEKLGKDLGVSVPEVVLSYYGNHAMNVVPIIGTTSPKRLEQNFKAFCRSLDEKTMKILNDLAC